MKPSFPAMRADRLPRVKQAEQKTGAVIYCRVSTKEQESNLSLPVQEKTCREYCDANGWTVLRIFKEAESAKSTNRMQFMEMLKFCTENRRAVRAVVFYDASRFSRETADYYQVKGYLKSKGVDTRSATQGFDNSPSGEFMETVLAGWATYDNRLRADKTIRGMKAAMERGRWPGRAPIGYINVLNARRDEPNIAQDQERAALIKRAFELYGTGTQTKSEVLRTITDLGLRDRSGNQISPQEFDKILRNPMYAGWMVAPGWESRRGARLRQLLRRICFSALMSVWLGMAGVGRPDPARIQIFRSTFSSGAVTAGSLLPGVGRGATVADTRITHAEGTVVCASSAIICTNYSSSSCTPFSPRKASCRFSIRS